MITPAILTQKVPMAPSEGDLLMQHADQSFRRGKKAYQANDLNQARKEFDTAIDLMLEASANNPSDPQAFDARLEEMVDAVHRYDLAGLGAGVDVDTAQFEKAPLEDLLQMTFPVDPKSKDKVKEQVQATASQFRFRLTTPFSAISIISTAGDARRSLPGWNGRGVIAR